jgi:hypothetical protein
MKERVGTMDQEKASRVAAIGDSGIELHIEELVLHGFLSRDRYAIADAVERELARLMAAPDLGGLARSRSHVERLDGGTFTVTPGASGHTVGAQVAQALYGTLVTPRKASIPKRPMATGKTRGPQ